MKLYLVTVPGLDVKSDWRLVHDRLLDDFPEVSDVLATTMPATILIVYEGSPQGGRWLEGVGREVYALAHGPPTRLDCAAAALA
jgi:hypothetical protein